MLRHRVISAAILIPLALFAIWQGAWLFALLVAVLTTLAGIEYVAMLKRKGYALALPLVWGMTYVWLVDALWGHGRWLADLLAAGIVLTTLWELWRRHRDPHRPDPTAQWALTMVGGLYLGMGGAYLLRLRALPDGLWWTLSALPIIWVSESAAYFVGRRWGKHKMSPTISPGKSWEGYAGQVIGGIGTGALCGWLWPTLSAIPISLTVGRGLLLGLLLSALATAGDFLVSMIKREVGVKDTGNLIPGHGGAFDRIDSVLWAGVLTWALVALVV